MTGDGVRLGYGGAAVTRREVGAGSAWYVATRLGVASLVSLVGRFLEAARVDDPAPAVPEGVEIVRRRGPDADYVFALNHTDTDVVVQLVGHELLTDMHVDHPRVPAGGTVVVATPPTSILDRGGADGPSTRQHPGHQAVSTGTA